MKKRIEKQPGTLWAWALAPLLVLVALLLPTRARAQEAAPSPLQFQLLQRGSMAAGTSVYAGPVTIEILLDAGTAARAQPPSVLIKENGIWMRLTPDEEGRYKVLFSADGRYERSFCLEDENGVRSEKKSATFVISAALAKFLADIDGLPDLQTADNQEVEGARQRIVEVQNRLASFSEALLGQVPEFSTYKLQRLVKWLQNMAPATDVTPPQAPMVSVRGKRAAQAEVYDTDTEVTVTLATTWDFGKLLMRSNGQWSQLTKDGQGAYRVPCASPGSYDLNFCVEDAAGNRSLPVSAAFSVDPAAYRLLGGIDMLYNTYLTAESLAEECAQAEDLLLDFQDLPPASAALIPLAEAEKLSLVYDELLLETGHLDMGVNDSGNFVQAVGLVKRLAPPALLDTDTGYYAGLTVKRENPNVISSQSSLVDYIALYDIGIDYHITGKNGVERTEAAQILPGQRVKIRVQVTPPMRGRKNVGVLRLGVQEDLAAKVKNADDGIIIEFYTGQMGKFILTAAAETAPPAPDGAQAPTPSPSPAPGNAPPSRAQGGEADGDGEKERPGPADPLPSPAGEPESGFSWDWLFGGDEGD